MNILVIGDVVEKHGIEILEKKLRGIKKLKDIAFTIVNGENSAGLGTTKDDVERMYDAGADVITLGNHAFDRRAIIGYIEDDRYLLRPANLTRMNPGRGYEIYDGPRGCRIAVICLQGRLFGNTNLDNPFTVVDEIIKGLDTKLIMVEIHGDATSEKLAMGRFLDGRVSGVYGTHTHVQTADEQVFPGGTGYITDIGMTGVTASILGMDIPTAISRFEGSVQYSYRGADGESSISGAIFELDEKSGKCLSVERINIV